VLGAHWVLVTQVEFPSAQVPAVQAGKVGSQHLASGVDGGITAGQPRDTQWRFVLQASLGPQGWSLAPLGIRWQHSFPVGHEGAEPQAR